MERVIVVGRRVDRCGKCFAVYGSRFGVVLRDEVAAVVAVGVSRAFRSLVAAIADRTFGIEQSFAARQTERHFLQVVESRKFFAIQFFLL